ncbi:MAG: sigma-70 family RNA polymerase sigma factor [bacterium]|nr:sigma-70 family RNA polymerase sigma factor [bacterium]
MNIQEIYDRQKERVYRLALLYLKNIADAEDAVSAIFLKVMTKKIEFHDLDHETAWFITATKNYCKDLLKASWRKKVDLGTLPERAAEESQSAELLSLVMELPPKYREVLYLYYYEGYSLRELSVMLKRKESTLQSRLATARKRLKAVLEREADGNDKA